MADEDSDVEARGDGEGDRPHHAGGGPYRQGHEDTFWLVLLAVIVGMIFLVGLVSALGPDAGPAHETGYTGWH